MTLVIGAAPPRERLHGRGRDDTFAETRQMRRVCGPARTSTPIERSIVLVGLPNIRTDALLRGHVAKPVR